MKSKISILECYITAEYKNKYYIIAIDTDENILRIMDNPENGDIFNIGTMDTKKEIDISKEFDKFIKNIELKYLKRVKEWRIKII